MMTAVAVIFVAVVMFIIINNQNMAEGSARLLFMAVLAFVIYYSYNFFYPR